MREILGDLIPSGGKDCGLTASITERVGRRSKCEKGTMCKTRQQSSSNDTGVSPAAIRAMRSNRKFLMRSANSGANANIARSSSTLGSYFPGDDRAQNRFLFLKITRCGPL